MAMEHMNSYCVELSNLLGLEPFKCKGKVDSEQLMQDFTQYKEKMELFFTAAQVVGAYTGDPVGRHEEAHTACNSCKQEKAMMVMLGGEEMKKLFKHVGGVVEDDSYIKAMAKGEQGIKRLTNQAMSKQCCNLVEDGDALEQPRFEVEDRCKMVAVRTKTTVDRIYA